MSGSTMSAAERKLRNARSVVVQAAPFYGALLLRQRVVEVLDGTCETMATDGDNLYFNPKFVEECSPTDLHFVCAHEALHPGLLHHTRRGDRDPDLWNEACDYAINPILVAAKFHMPKGGLLRQDLTGMSAEKIYEKLQAERRAQKKQESGGGSKPAQGGPSKGQGGGSSSAPQAQPSGQPQQGQGQPTGQGGGKPMKDFGGTGCLLDGPKDPGKRAQSEAEWKVAVTQAAMQAGGTMPGELKRTLDGILNPRADWRELLRRFMDQFAKADYSWEQPNRRFVSSGMYLPSLRSEALPAIAFVIDASMSMSARALQQAMSEVQAICSDLRPEHLDVIVHDTEIRDVRRFEVDEPTDGFKVTAGGGTRFTSVCDYLEQQGEEYACVIWFTDMYPNEPWSSITNAPSCPLIWVDYGDSKVEPTFGDEVVRMPAEELQ